MRPAFALPRSSWRVVAILLGAGAPLPAAAQLLQDAPTVVIPPEPPLSTAQSVFTRDKEVTVADRMLPAFTAQGTTIGEFDLFPALSIGGLFTSNIFDDNSRRQSDEGIVLRPELTVRTSSGPYQVEAYGRGDFRRFANHTSEDTEEGLGGVQGSVAVGPLSSISAGASFASLIDPRFAADSPQDAARPLHYTALDDFIAATIEGATTRLILRGSLEQLRFGSTPSTSGGELFTADRDRTRYDGLARLERALNPAVSFYVAATGNRIDYRLDTDGGTRDSTGYGLYLGTSFEASALIRGDVRLGYIRQNFDLAGVRPIQGLGALGTLVYSPTQLWTFTIQGESTVQDSGVPGSGGFLHRGASIRADNELRRYLIASLEGGYFKDTYRGLDRRDNLPFADAGLTYLSRGHWNARLGYQYIARNCTCSSGVTNFDDHRVSATLTLQD